MTKTQRKGEHAIVLAAIHLYDASHLATEALNETVVQNQILLDVYRHISARDQTKTETKTQGAMSALLYHRQQKRTVNVSRM